MEVKIIRLVTGEQIISQVEETEDVIKLEQPMMIVILKEGLQMVPWLIFSATSNVEISKQFVMLIHDPQPQLEQHYQQQTGSIMTAPANALDEKGKLIV